METILHTVPSLTSEESVSSAIVCHLVSQGPFMSLILGDSQIPYIVERTHEGAGGCILNEFRENVMDESRLSAEAEGWAARCSC